MSRGSCYADRSYLDVAVAQPCRYGAGDPAVLLRLFQLLREVAYAAPGSEGGIERQLGRLERAAAAQDFDNSESQQLRRSADEVRRALDGKWRA